MASHWRLAAVVSVALGLLSGVAGAQIDPGAGDRQKTWVITNGNESHYEGIYGQAVWVNLEQLLSGEVPLRGSFRTRGILNASPKPRPGDEGTGTSGTGTNAHGQSQSMSSTGTARRTYSLTLPIDRPASTVTMRTAFPITPGVMVEPQFEFEVDSLNRREIEVVGTFEQPMGTDRGPTGFWFWAYSIDPSIHSRAARTGLVLVSDLVARADHLTGETVKVEGQFRGHDVFHDLDGPGAPEDGWVIRGGGFSIWVVGRKPRGKGWSLDPTSRGDTTKWVQVTGKLERRGGVVALKAEEVALVAQPKETPDP